jgi:hypothetical protein
MSVTLRTALISLQFNRWLQLISRQYLQHPLFQSHFTHLRQLETQMTSRSEGDELNGGGEMEEGQLPEGPTPGSTGERPSSSMDLEEGTTPGSVEPPRTGTPGFGGPATPSSLSRTPIPGDYYNTPTPGDENFGFGSYGGYTSSIPWSLPSAASSHSTTSQTTPTSAGSSTKTGPTGPGIAFPSTPQPPQPHNDFSTAPGYFLFLNPAASCKYFASATVANSIGDGQLITFIEHHQYRKGNRLVPKNADRPTILSVSSPFLHLPASFHLLAVISPTPL